MTAFADLVLPDTTYLERHDVMSMLDRPISEFDGPVDSVRIPVLPPTGECKPFQEVLIELGDAPEAAGLRARRTARASSATIPTSSSTTRPSPARASASSPAGAARAARSSCAASPTRSSGRCTPRTTACSTTSCRRRYQYMRNWNQGYMEWAQRDAHAPLRRADPDPPLLRGAADASASRRRASGRTRQPPAHLRKRIETYFDPLPFYYEPLEAQATDTHKYPLTAVTQRPMAMYHSWDSQNAWLRQIHTHNYLFVNPRTARAAAASPTATGSGSSRSGARCAAWRATREAVEPGTVWTWNAIGKAPGAWSLAPDANEVAARLPAQPPDHRGAAGAGRRARLQLRSDHRPGRLVRRARAHLQGRRRRSRGQTSPQFRGRRHPRASSTRARAWLAFVRRGSAIRGSKRGTLAMTQLALVIDLNVCVGCHACVTSCKEWNTSGAAGSLSDEQPLRHGSDRHLLQPRADLRGRRVSRTRRRCTFPKSCLHCEDPPCVPVCPTGASYKRAEDGIVLVDYDKCIGCKYCAWACPYGARELDEHQKVMKKCTLCVDRIYDEPLPPAERKPACVMACPTNARLFGDIHDPRVGGVAGDPRGRRLRADARVGHAAGQPLPAAAQDRDASARRTSWSAPTIRSRSTASCPKPSPKSPSLDDVTTW